MPQSKLKVKSARIEIDGSKIIAVLVCDGKKWIYFKERKFKKVSTAELYIRTHYKKQITVLWRLGMEHYKQLTKVGQ
jgi:hypothetical protein